MTVLNKDKTFFPGVEGKKEKEDTVSFILNSFIEEKLLLLQYCSADLQTCITILYFK